MMGNIKDFIGKEVKIKSEDIKVLFKIKQSGKMQLIYELFIDEKLFRAKVYLVAIKFVYNIKSISWISLNYNYMSMYIKLLFNLGPYLLFFSRLCFYFYSILVGILKFFILIFLLVLVALKYSIYLLVLLVIILRFMYRLITLILEHIALLKFFILHALRLVWNFFVIRKVELIQNFTVVSVAEREWSFDGFRNMDMYMSYTYNDRFSMYDLPSDHVELDLEDRLDNLNNMDEEALAWVRTLDDNEYFWPFDYIFDEDKTSLMDMFANFEIKETMLSFYEEALEFRMEWDYLEYEVAYMLGVDKEPINIVGEHHGIDKLKYNFLLYSFWTRDTIFFNYSYNLLFFESLRSLGVLDNILGLGDLQNETAYALDIYYNMVYTNYADEKTAIDQGFFDEDSDTPEVYLFEEYLDKVWLEAFSEEGLDNVHNHNGRRLPDFFYGMRLYELIGFFRSSYSLNFVWYLNHIKLKMVKLNIFSMFYFKFRVFIYKFLTNDWFRDGKN